MRQMNRTSAIWKYLRKKRFCNGYTFRFPYISEFITAMIIAHNRIFGSQL